MVIDFSEKIKDFQGLFKAYVLNFKDFLEKFYRTKKEDTTCIGLKAETGLGTSILENVFFLFTGESVANF